MSGNKVIKPVSFNIKREDDQKMLKHLKRRNFSGYVKKLILADIARKEAEKNRPEVEPIKSRDGAIKFDLTQNT